AKSTHERGNAAHPVHLAGLLLLLPRPTGRCEPECAAMVRLERDGFWSGIGLAVHSSPSWPERAYVASCGQKRTYGRAIAIQLQTIFPGALRYFHSGEPGDSIPEQLHRDRTLASS